MSAPVDSGRQQIAVIGQGALAQAVQRRLASEYSLSTLTAADLSSEQPGYALLVLLEDDWSSQTHKAVNAFCVQHGQPWLRAYVEPGLGIVGPLVLPDQTGCAVCADTRRLAAHPHLTAFARLRTAFANGQARLPIGALAGPTLDSLAALVCAEVERFLVAPDQVRTVRALIELKLTSLESSVHRFLADPHCPHCAQMPDDSRAAAAITLQPQHKHAPGSFRVRSLTAEQDALMTRYVDGQTGMVRSLIKHTQNVYANVSAYIRTSGRDADEIGFGRTLNYEASQVAAIAEALERYGGMRPRGKRTTIRASYRDLGQDALDPVTLGLHTAEQYARPNFPFAPYQPDLAYNWVWGYSFQRQRPLLVPECCAYYGLRAQPGADRSFVCEISNGCALGGCLEEAILYGILEVAERDAFLLTWYAQLSAPRIDLRSAADRSLRLLVERIEHQTGYSVHAFNITVEHGIPCFWVMAVDEQDRPDTPKLLCAAGSHLDPEQALANALHELAPNTAVLPDVYRAKQQQAAQLCADPWQVRQMEDHQLAYAHPGAFDRVRFLYDTSRQQTFQEAFPEWYRGQRSLDLRDDLQAVIERYLATGLDVIVVDQTTPEQAVGDFRCVKVLIPGTLSMTFGHEARRTSGLERLKQLPHQLGYRAQPLTEAEINPYPHPFP